MFILIYMLDLQIFWIIKSKDAFMSYDYDWYDFFRSYALLRYMDSVKYNTLTIVAKKISLKMMLQLHTIGSILYVGTVIFK